MTDMWKDWPTGEVTINPVTDRGDLVFWVSVGGEYVGESDTIRGARRIGNALKWVPRTVEAVRSLFKLIPTHRHNTPHPCRYAEAQDLLAAIEAELEKRK